MGSLTGLSSRALKNEEKEIKCMRLTWLFKNERITSVSGHHAHHPRKDGALRLEPVSLARSAP